MTAKTLTPGPLAGDCPDCGVKLGYMHRPDCPRLASPAPSPAEDRRSSAEGEAKANHDCLAKRRPDEPMFILLGRDPDAHNIVRTWAERRLAAGGDPEHCQMGLDTAERMRAYASDPANRPASAPEASAYPAQHPVTEGAGEAVARVQKYLTERAKMRQMDPEEIHGLHIGDDREATLMASDLRAILAALQPSDGQGEPEIALEDAANYGVGFLVDGRRVAPERVTVCHGPESPRPDTLAEGPEVVAWARKLPNAPGWLFSPDKPTGQSGERAVALTPHAEAARQIEALRARVTAYEQSGVTTIRLMEAQAEAAGLREALEKVRREARKAKPDPDRLHGFADEALAQTKAAAPADGVTG